MSHTNEHVHFLASWFVNQAANMLFLQSDRLFGKDADIQTSTYDFWFLLSSAHQLRKAAALAERSARDGDSIAQAIAGLDDCIPNLAMARNILMHFDEYIAGEGRQREDASTVGISPDSLSLFEFRRSTRTIIWSPTKAILGSSEGGFRVKLNELEECTRNLREAVDDSEAREGDF